MMICSICKKEIKPNEAYSIYPKLKKQTHEECESNAQKRGKKGA